MLKFFAVLPLGFDNARRVSVAGAVVAEAGDLSGILPGHVTAGGLPDEAQPRDRGHRDSARLPSHYTFHVPFAATLEQSRKDGTMFVTTDVKTES